MSKEEVLWVRVESNRHPGRCYYYNRVSKTSTWERPPELKDVEIPSHSAVVKGEKKKVADVPSSKPLQNAWNQTTEVPADKKRSAPEIKKVNNMEIALNPPQANQQDRPTMAGAPMAMIEKGGDDREEAMEVERWGDDEEVAMDIDVSQEDIAEIKSVRNTVSSPSQLSIESFGIPADYTNDFSGKLYLVLDTNVLLSHLNFLEELKDFAIKGVGKPVLVIPWIVMQELDKHKSLGGGRLAGKARKAIRLLFNCFSSNHSRVRCQTMEETHTEIHNMAIENNDDRILHCCLLYQMKTQGHNGVVVLFSNDINLCSKAMGNGVQAADRTTLFKELRSLCRAAPTKPASTKPPLTLKLQPVPGHAPNHASNTVHMASPPLTPFFSPTTPHSGLLRQPQSGLFGVNQGIRQSKEVNDLLAEAESTLCETLTAPLTQEMMNAFDTLWSTMVVVKPPWSLKDQLFLIEKHWIAVYGQVLPHHTRAVASQMWHSVRNRPGVLTVEEALRFVGRAVTLLQGFRDCNYCAHLIQKAISDLNQISKKLQAIKKQSPTLEAGGKVGMSPFALPSPVTPDPQQIPVAPVPPLAPSAPVPRAEGSASSLPLLTIPSITTSSVLLKDKLTRAVQTPPSEPSQQLEWVLALVHDSIIYSQTLIQETVGTTPTAVDRANVSSFARQIVEILSQIVSSLQNLLEHGVNIPRMQETLVAFDYFLSQALLVNCPLTIDVFFELTSNQQQRGFLKTALKTYTAMLADLHAIDAKFHF